MRPVLLVVGLEELKNILELNFKSYLDVDTVHVDTVDDAIERLDDEDNNFSLIVSMSEIESSKPVLEINDYLSKQDQTIPIVSLGDDPQEKQRYSSAQVYSVDQYDDIRSVLRHGAHILGVTAKDMANAPTSKFFPIAIDHFFSLSKSPTDVYIKIGRGEKTQFIKRIHEGEGLDEEAVKRYRNKGVENLFIPSDKRLHFINSLTVELLKVLDCKDPEPEPEKALQATEIAQATVAKNIEALGVTPEIAQMADKAIDQMIIQSEKHPKVGKLLKRLSANKSSFSFKHTQLATYMCMIILKKIDWGKKEQFKTLSFVSFFHDISLPNDKLTRIHTQQEFEQADLNQGESELVNRHAQVSAELIHKYPHMPMGADTIIRQHHGTLNGLGFTDTYSGNLSPLCVVFIVAEECAHIVLKSEQEELNKRKIMFELERKFKTTRFKKMLEALEEVL